MEGKFNGRESRVGRGPGEQESNAGAPMDREVLCKLQNPFHHEINPLMQVVKSILGISLWLRARKAEIYRARKAFGYVFRPNLFIQRGQEVHIVFMPRKVRDSAPSSQLSFSFTKVLPLPSQKHRDEGRDRIPSQSWRKWRDLSLLPCLGLI